MLAMLLGMIVRTAWTPPERFEPGIDLPPEAGAGGGDRAAGRVGEPAAAAAGGGAAGAGDRRRGRALALAAGYGIGRALGLNPRLATLIACGNAICGNSAIAAVAPVIGADQEDVASSIAFTAVLGVIVVLTLPLLVPLLGLDDFQYGALAGMTVYAVPQVLAATFPVGRLAARWGRW